jgi:hypothetical protein
LRGSQRARKLLYREPLQSANARGLIVRNPPTFIVFGASRSGTTGLYTYLKQHPDVFMSPHKETNFFAYEGRALDFAGPGGDWLNDSITRLEDYEAIFARAGAAKARGEASPLYLFEPGTAERIRRHAPDARLIAILRNPADQIYSHYLYARRQTLEPLDDFDAALDAEDSRLAANWQPMFRYARFPRYAEQLSRYRAVFPEEQMKIFLYEDFESRPGDVMRDIFTFIGVDEDFAPDFSYRPNAGGAPKNRALQDFVMKPNPLTALVARVVPMEARRRLRDAISNLNVKKEACPPRTRARLVASLRSEIDALETMLGRDLSSWKR